MSADHKQIDSSSRTPVPPNGRGVWRRIGNAPSSLRFQLLAAVNVVMVIGLAIILAVDYHRELNDRLLAKQTALAHQAMLLAPAIQRLDPADTSAIQTYIDEVCAQMHQSSAPGHHILVRLGGTAGAHSEVDHSHANAVVLQARAHFDGTPDMVERLGEAAGAGAAQLTLAGKPYIFGTYRDHFGGSGGTLDIFISESVSNVLQEVRGHLLWRMGAMALLGVVAMGVIDLILIRLVTRPLGRLVRSVRRISDGHLGDAPEPFRTSEMRFVSEEIASMSAALAGNERHRRIEMDKGRRIQENLLPRGTQVRGATFDTLFEPASAVGGDYFDVLPLPDGSSLWCIADVTGHGVPAAMGAAMLKTLLVSVAPSIETDLPLPKVLAFLSARFLAVTLPEDFASMFLLRWRPKEGIIDYASAGHETAYLISRNGNRRQMPSTGPLLGVDESARWTTATIPISEGDRLFIFTDGAAETIDPDQKVFGRKQFGQLLHQVGNMPRRDALDTVAHTLIQHRGDRSPTDDMTLVAVDFAPDRQITPREPSEPQAVAVPEEDRC
jgi:phosphoserine phosphatase RsbU/P